MTIPAQTGCPFARDWLGALRRYVLFAALVHLIWEFAHLPLYTIWETGTPGELVFAAAHCTGGDILITLSTFMLSLFLFARASWPHARHWPVLAGAVVFGVAYTIFSEWLNIEVREAWAYRDVMPVIPVIDAGLSPVLQWIVIPITGYCWATGIRPWRRECVETAHG
jgi:hypothetical protein